jgi:hypothetical protein
VFRPKKLGVRGEPQQLALFVRLVPRPSGGGHRSRAIAGEFSRVR